MSEKYIKTKIVCTIGPASANPGIIRELILNGMSVARLNFSHGSRDEHSEKIFTIRKISTELGKPVSILQDLAGPKIRVGKIPDPGARLETGGTFILTTRVLEGNDNIVSVSDPYLPEEVVPGDRILLADGFMELKVREIKESEICCEIITGGSLTSNKGINLPTRTMRTDSITEKDREDLIFGIEKDVDYIALSFVRTAEDIIRVKDIIGERKKNTPVIAKIEKHEAIANISDIMEVSDGVMVARGDLGVEIPLEQVPVIQKQLIEKANRLGKPVIIATQMLRSMVDSPRPTRAEAGDVANSVLDGTDAIMLSEETAMGSYPVGAVKYMARIAKKAEEMYPHEKYLQMTPENNIPESVAHASCILADHLDAAAIIAPTRSGRTAGHISRFRPRCPIIALSANPVVVRRMSLLRGCFPGPLTESRDENNIIKEASLAAQETGLVKKGDLVVITSGQPDVSFHATNNIRVVMI